MKLFHCMKFSETHAIPLNIFNDQYLTVNNIPSSFRTSAVSDGIHLFVPNPSNIGPFEIMQLNQIRAWENINTIKSNVRILLIYTVQCIRICFCTLNGSGIFCRTSLVFGKTFPIAIWHAVTSDRDLMCKNDGKVW